ncbi:hypothetical protein [Phaeocystidibacter marisrubri]|uniref:Uncharacterized protein n=1 Tax=Phaeocystidibacter marisrubri TaxID=1577780 RepID=A0A6L3ZKA4_9FLAO|nr:hypothetical protein [Phaeocystidibacter marisrubri]KAB2818079.1 hypothetical protein F8C82_06670 [Phaeocystidibacter marisrubri]GGH72054.1 hypothetical protein GCM10011318_15640 [Phaeocystidibacter marisrubri]
MKMINPLLTLCLLTISLSCNSGKTDNDSSNLEMADTLYKDSAARTVDIRPRIINVTYGSFCGHCIEECTRMYSHYLIGNATTFWTDTTDSYFKDGGLRCETEMSRESQKIGFELINSIPESILKSDSTRNVFGCPDCNDGCGLYFEFTLDKPNSEPIIYEMEYGLDGTTGEIKQFGERIIRTIEKLESHRLQGES